MRVLLQRFYNLLLVLSCISMVGALAAITLNIVTRLVNGWTISGLDGYAGYAIAATLFLALPSAFLGGDHVRVTILTNKAKGKARDRLDYLALCAGVALSTYVAWFSCRLVWQSHVFHDVAPTGDATPMWIPQLSMALGCVGLAVAVCHALFDKCKYGVFLDERVSSSPSVE
ncbi:MAG: TRAP transporter small permease [Burkholderiaceae bacterium]|jgi:TRAP-type C4-dicarboxylate transport system permease small subunit